MFNMVQPSTTNIIIALIGFFGIIIAALITKHRIQNSFYKEMQKTYQGIIKDQDNTIVNLRAERDYERKDMYKVKNHMQIIILEVEKLKTRQCITTNCPNRVYP